MTNKGTPLVELKDISISFGGIKAVDKVSVDLHPGEVVGLLIMLKRVKYLLMAKKLSLITRVMHEIIILKQFTKLWHWLIT